VTLGLSLPLGYLNGADETADAKCLSEAFGKPCDCLAELKDQGVSSIEISGFSHDMASDILLDSVRSILSSGMQLTLHGYLTSNTASRLFGDIYPQLLPTITYLKDQHEKTVMVVHALADLHASYRNMVESTARELGQLAESIQACNLPVRVSLEINRFHGIETPGASYEGLLEIAKHVRNPNIGFCWDMGHTRSSVLQNRLPAVPPPEFIRKVNHTHLHGLSPDGDTHGSLTESSSHIASGISRLMSCGYDGAYNLELYPARWETENNVRDEILGSVLCLRTILSRLQEDTSTENNSVEPADAGDGK